MTFHDEHLTMQIIATHDLPEGRELASIGFRSVAHGILERTGTTAVRVSRPIVPRPEQAQADPEFIAWLRGLLVDDANQHLRTLAAGHA